MKGKTDEEILNEREKAIKKAEEEGCKNLENINNKVDFVITHCGATSSMALYSYGEYNSDILTDYLEEIHQRVDFVKWFMGHYHVNHAINDKEIILYEQIVRIV